MDGLRTVTVLEHEVIPVIKGGDGSGRLTSSDPCLSEVEAQALLRLNDLRRGFCERLSGGVKLAQYCGIVRLSTCMVTQGPPLHLATRGPTDVFLLKPDITVWHTGQDGAASSIDRIVDAKWKRLDPRAGLRCG